MNVLVQLYGHKKLLGKATSTLEIDIPGFVAISESHTLRFSWPCISCGSMVAFTWPPTKSTDATFMKSPSTEYFPLETLKRIVDGSNTLRIYEKKGLTFIVFRGSVISPSLILVQCIQCRCEHCVSYAIGIGAEDRPPRPNTFGIREVFQLATPSKPELA